MSPRIYDWVCWAAWIAIIIAAMRLSAAFVLRGGF